MNTILNLPINRLITKLSDVKGSAISYEDLKNEVLKKEYCVSVKEDDTLAQIYYNDTHPSDENSLYKDIETSCRSYIFEKSTLLPIATQYNRIIYNEEAIDFLKNKDWSKVTVQKCYEGTLLLLFHHNNKWYVTTRRCLDAKESTWIRNKSYKDMFDEARKDIFSFDDLNKDYCYHFVLMHHKNKNIVDYTHLGKDYKKLLHILTTEKYTLKEINYVIPGIENIDDEYFESLDELLNKINELSNNDETHFKVTCEGYVLKYYGEPDSVNVTTLKLQTRLYQYLMKMKPNNSNIYQSYLELYQKDKLLEFLPFFNEGNNDIVKRINISLKTIAKEVLDIYHATRHKSNPIIYSQLGEMYKKVLYTLHGKFINNKKINSNYSISIHDVYHYIKELPAYELRQIYYERQLLVSKDCNFINRNCIYTTTQTMLMFKDDPKN